MTGKRWSDGHLKRRFKKVLSKAEIEDFRFHDLRHTTASLLIEQGESPKYIQKQMRHASIEITFNRYLQPPGPDPDRIGIEQLFDLQEDPGETKNLAFDEDKHELVMQCRQALLDFEAGLDRRRITTERGRPGGAILNWSKRLRTHWDEHPEFEAMRIHQ